MVFPPNLAGEVQSLFIFFDSEPPLLANFGCFNLHFYPFLAGATGLNHLKPPFLAGATGFLPQGTWLLQLPLPPVAGAHGHGAALRSHARVPAPGRPLERSVERSGDGALAAGDRMPRRCGEVLMW